ncbi:ATP-binding protein [Lactococcus lactis]|uniref:ATP-binding protein n=1 Tax=Lactococcus lactis TaxID=1358 RepID=UPI0021A3B871|nr:ATP-binding protein [Lactococcus lactis]MCT3132951.1 hypothetical protein [Lactococcus lactis]
MVMQIKPAGVRKPKLNRILISGCGGSGKTTLAAKFASSPERALFISTDGNANRQGYMAIDFEFPQKAEQVVTNFLQALNIAEQSSDSWEVLVIDLIEDFDERTQSLLRNEFSNQKSAQRAWGKINSLFKDMQSLLMSKFRDKTIILLSRDVEEFDKKTGEIIGYTPALRRAMKNIILKDQDVEIRAYFDRNHNRQFDISNLRYEETKRTLQQIIAKQFEIPQPAIDPKEQQEAQEKAQKLKAQYDKAFAAAKERGASDNDLEYWENMEPYEAIMSISDWVRIKESAQSVVDEEEPIVDELFPVGQN